MEKPERPRGGKKHKRGIGVQRSERWEPRHDRSASAVVAEEVAPFWECSQGEEPERNEYGLMIPARKSLTAKQHLGIIDKAEFEPLAPVKRLQPTRMKDDKGRSVVVLTETSDPGFRRTWKRPSTLLRQGKPDQFGEGKRGTTFTRITSRSKERIRETERKVDPNAQINIAGTGPLYDESEDLGLPPGSAYHK